MMDIDPEVAYQHAHAAYQRAARVDVVREALGLTAYITERYAEALRELRTYRRMSDDYSHIPIEADSERGLGRPEKALRFIEGIPLARLDAEAKIELVIVISGARSEVGDAEGGLAVLEKVLVENLEPQLAARVQLTKADRLEELGHNDEAQELRAQWQSVFDGDQDFSMMVDLDDILDDMPEEDPQSEEHNIDEHDDFADVEDLDPEEFGEEFQDDDFDDAEEFDDELEELEELDDDVDIDETDEDHVDDDVDEEFAEAFDELFDDEESNE